jgi:hypothetical protein
MGSDLEQAVSAFEEAVDGLSSLAAAAAYALRLAANRVADVTGAASRREAGAPSPSELERLIDSLGRADERFSDVVVLALGDHFRAFLARALQLGTLPPLPASPRDLEELAGTPGTLARCSPWLPLLLQLYRVALKGGALDREVFQVFGKAELEVPFRDGKVRLFQVGDRVTLGDRQIEQAGRALIEAARSIQLALLTA